MPWNMNSSFGGRFVAPLMAGLSAVFAAVAGFVGAIFLCGKLLSSEFAVLAVFIAPTTALILGIATFVVVFRKISTYREDPDRLR
jgi:hypothetical protein